MQSMKFFIDTHDVASNTFPTGLEGLAMTS